jgi:hypothetical protein
MDFEARCLALFAESTDPDQQRIIQRKLFARYPNGN